ncbi:hypothetical protein AeMF1_005695 [Aphanomyces euteiches]|nr:hypothetical protein AeMF1_005695 [Aphanomyces euteiches]
MSGSASDDEDYIPDEEEGSIDSSDDDHYAPREFILDEPCEQASVEEAERLCAVMCCTNACLTGKTKEVAKFLESMKGMSKDRLSACIYTTISLCGTFDALTGKRKRGTGKRNCFTYMVPLVGTVCRPSFQALFKISNDKLNGIKQRVYSGNLQPKHHKNIGNKNAASLDVDRLTEWFQFFGEIVPIQTRIRKAKDGEDVSTYSTKPMCLLPSFFTWDQLHKEYMKYNEDCHVRIAVPSISAFRKILTAKLPNISIRTPRDNVCDLCVIYKNSMSKNPNVVETEAFGLHVKDAMTMRTEYQFDCAAATEEHLVLSMDYAQNVMLPHTAQCPSAWYFCSLISVSVFGIYDASIKVNNHFIYSEKVGGKGCNEVVSLLDRYLRHVGAIGEQEQHSRQVLVKYLLWLVDSGQLEEVNLKFLVKGHTKNSCDRGFGSVRKRLLRNDAWTFEQLTEHVEKSSKSSRCFPLEDEAVCFYNFRDPLAGLYSDIKSIQQFQLFTMSKQSKGQVQCRIRPNQTAKIQNLVKRGVDVNLHSLDAKAGIPRPPVNLEKLCDIYSKVRPHVPQQFQDDELYKKPTNQDLEQAKIAKTNRRKRAQPEVTDPCVITDEVELYEL